MPLYEKKWWKKLFSKKEPKTKVDVLKNTEALIEYLGEISNDAKELQEKLNKLEELEKEFLVAKPSLIPINLETQAKLLDEILQYYEGFQNDADINGLRIKMVAQEFLKRAASAGLKNLVTEKKKDHKWQFQW